jgi:23S rRNA (uracil1939-C5)-methyltransferase
MGRRREPETARIESVTHDGRGIAALAGKKVFVAGALEGETVRFQRRKKRRNYDEAELLEVIEASPGRIEPRCPVFGICGGCSLQHVSAHEQRDIKLRALTDSLHRIGNTEPETWLEALHAPGTDGNWNYRRRARLAVKDVPGKNRVLVGFRERHAPYVTDMHRCDVLAAPVNALLDALSSLIGGMSIRSRVPQIEVAVADNATVLLFRVLDPPNEADLGLMREFAASHDVRVMLQPGGLDSISSLTPDEPQAPLFYELPDFDIRIQFEPTDFVQINAAVNRLMVARAVELLDVGSGDSVLDLFCGIGNFSLPLARRARHVLGIEGEQRQVTRARENAAQNDVGNCEFRVSDLAVLDGSENWLSEHWDRVLLDPARSGAASAIEHSAVLDAGRIVYVSCHPGTLARDAGELVRRHGYHFESAGIIDMFPHTGHVESIAVFSKK